MSVIVAPDQGAETASKRYQLFETCIYVASQSCSTKWTWEQFVTCFPTWVKEEAGTAGEIRMQISRFMKDNLVKECNELLRRYDARTSIDALDEAVVEAKKNQASGKTGHQKDEWKPEIDPRSAVRARVLPVLEQEQLRLQKELDDLEKQNREYIAKIEQTISERKSTDRECKQLLGRFEQVHRTLRTIDHEELQQWMLAADEAGTASKD